MSDYNPFSLAGKTILVTGASSGIGQATAVECSRLGAKLVVTGRNEERLVETLSRLDGDGHVSIAAELTDAEALKRLVDNCPSLDGLVLCAGRGMTLPFLFSSIDKFKTLFDVNFNSTVECFRMLAKAKKLGRGSSVVIIDSIGGTPNGRFSPGNCIYGASKAALWSIMKFAALELAPKGIRVNTVNPAMVETPLIKSVNITDEQKDLDRKRYPLGRYGRPEEVAYGIIYLLSDAAAWVTGQSLILDGGVTI